MEVKIIRKASFTPESLEQFSNDLENFKNIEHPTIVEVTEVFEDYYYWYLVTEETTGIPFFDRVA